MIKDDLRNLLAAEQSLDVASPQVDAWVEAGRQMVLSADGKHIWENLRIRTTLAITANTAEYSFPPDGSDDPPISKLAYVEKQAETDAPIKIYSDEEAAETEFVDELGGVILYPADQPGQVKLLFKLTPTSSTTLNVGYRKVPGDDLDFVKPESHDVFIFALRVIAPLKGVTPETMAAVRLQNYQAYLDRLQAAISNDFTATQENLRSIPALPFRQLQDTLATFQGDRD